MSEEKPAVPIVADDIQEAVNPNRYLGNLEDAGGGNAAFTSAERPLQDQPTPPPDAPPTVLDLKTVKFDTVVLLANDDQGGAGAMNIKVVSATPEPDVINNPAHYMGQWLARNFGWMLGLAMDQYHADKAIHEATERSKIRLVAADGTRLER